MNNVPPAFVLNWTSRYVDILCPFPSCDQKVHTHGYSTAINGHLNTRRASCCTPWDLSYRLLFPYEDDPLLRNFGFVLNRKQRRWESVADELEDPRIGEEREELLCAELARTKISTTADQYVLDGEVAKWFISECITNDLSACKRRLETFEHPEALVKGKHPHNGKTSLSYACEEGHLGIVELLCQHGADLESIDNEGHTPLMLATLHGHGETACYLVQRDASLFVVDNNGTTLIETAKTALRDLKELAWSKATIPIYSLEMPSPGGMEQIDKRNAMLRRLKERSDGLKKVIDLYLALKPERDTQKRASREPKEHHTFGIIQSNGAYGSRIMFNQTLFETRMAREYKTFAYLDRGRPFERVRAAAVSGFTAGKFGDDDGCLDRSLWTSRVRKYCKVTGHELSRVDQSGRSVTEEYHACHAEKQLMSYFLWVHTALDHEFDDSADGEETWGNCPEIGELEACKPNVAVMKKDIYVSRKPCPDCKLFRERVYEKAGIYFNLIYMEPILTERVN